MHCPNCLTPVDDDATECPKCGARRGYAGAYAGIVREKISYLGILPMCFIGALSVVMMVFGLLLAAGQIIDYNHYIRNIHENLEPGLPIKPIHLSLFPAFNSLTLLFLSYSQVRRMSALHWFGPEGHWGRVPPRLTKRPDPPKPLACPLCQTPVQPRAVSCPTCRARRGYAPFFRCNLVVGRDRIREPAIFLSILWPLCLIVSCFDLYSRHARLQYRIEYNNALLEKYGAVLTQGQQKILESQSLPIDSLLFFAAINVLIMLAVFHVVFHLARGPRWFPPYDPARKGRPRPVDDGDAAPHGRRTGSHT